VNVNITMLLSIERYEQVIDTTFGPQASAGSGDRVDTVASWPSFFLSRIELRRALLAAGETHKRQGA